MTARIVKPTDQRSEVPPDGSASWAGSEPVTIHSKEVKHINLKPNEPQKVTIRDALKDYFPDLPEAIVKTEKHE
jgi:hypothetical protein